MRAAGQIDDERSIAFFGLFLQPKGEHTPPFRPGTDRIRPESVKHALRPTGVLAVLAAAAALVPIHAARPADAQSYITVVDTYRTSHPGIRWEFRQEGPPRVWFDSLQIRRAVTNLLDNAVAALGEHGSITVMVAHDEAAGKARIDVADDGPGIPSGDRDRLFEPYFSRREGGTGLGLAIVSAIANDHGGTVRMRDNSPRGTVFELEFPARPPAKGKKASATPGIDDGRRRN